MKETNLKSDKMLEEALKHASIGFYVFPVKKDKLPHIKDWPNTASIDPLQITKWFTKWPDANIGVVTGKKSGVAVLDIDCRDDRNGADTLKIMEVENTPLPKTPFSLTGGGGFHYFFKCPEGGLPSKNGIANGIDFKADGGYVVVPPSVHESGNTYKWDNPLHEMELANVPLWLVSMMNGPKKIGQQVTSKDDGQSPIEEGKRNDTLFKVAAQYLKRGNNAAETKTLLYSANTSRCQPSLSIEEVDKIIASAVKSVGPQVGNKDQQKKGQGQSISLEQPELWSNVVDGDKLACDIKELITQYIVLSDHSANALSLWVLHAWCIDAFEISPYVLIKSPEKGCGKTTLLDILAGVSPKPFQVSNATVAAIFRLIETCQPTLLMDEADTYLDDRDGLGGVLNAGHRKNSAFVVRVEGKKHEPRRFTVWGPKVVAGIGNRRDTLEDRSIIITMKRKTSAEKVDRLRNKYFQKQAEPIKQKCFRWATDNVETLENATPEVPDELVNRAVDNWEPLLATADILGGEWPEKAREAALALSLNRLDSDKESDGIKILEDVRHLLENKKINDQLNEWPVTVFSEDIVLYLGKQEGRPWDDYNHGKPITANGVARLLKPYGIKSKTIRAEKKAKGYYSKDFNDAFNRYLAPLPLQNVAPVAEFNDKGLSEC